MMRVTKCLVVGAGFALALPALAFAATLEGGQFFGDLTHSVSAPGTFTVGETVTIYVDLDPVQDTASAWWYPWDLGNKEYTAVVSAVVNNFASGVSDVATFDPGTIAVYEAAAFNADCANRASYTDGSLILSGTVDGMVATRDLAGNNMFPWRVNGDINFTGGAGFANLDPQAVGNIIMNDAIDPAAPFFLSPCDTERYNTDWKSPEVTSVETSSWGRVKDLWR